MFVANPLDVMLRAFVAPVLIGAGFSRAGRTYRLAAGSGDLAVVAFQAWTYSPDVVGFYATAGLAPVPWVAWIHRDDGESTRACRPGIEAKLVGPDIVPPREWWRGVGDPEFHPLWGFERSVSCEGCGRALATVLAEHAVPTLRRLLDRRALLTEFRSPTEPSLRGPLHPPELNEILLLVDDGPSGELNELLRRLDAAHPDSEFAAWTRRRLAHRAVVGG